jgi:arylsulfatase A
MTGSARSLRILLGVTAVAGMFCDGCAASRGRPNFLVILCDDLGYGDLACYGNKTIRTPNLDRLAEEGMRLTACYAAAPVCSPSRAGLLTGRTPTRTGVYDWIPAGHAMHLPASEITVATLLQRGGYHTGHFGKWHCNGKFNSPEQPQPDDHGFEYWFSTQNNAIPSHRNPKNFVRNGTPVGEMQGFSCQLVADEAIRWLESVRAREPRKPFFAFVCFHEPHEPIDSPEELVALYPDAKKKGEALYYANVTNMDRAVGRLLAALKEMDLADDTLVWFTSDNGPETPNRYRGAWRSYGSPGPLRGMKLWVYEGGIRVPGIVRWPGRVTPGQVSDQPVSGVDVLPTLCALAGVDIPHDRALDGTDVTPVFRGHSIERPKPLFWHYYRALGGPRMAMRDGDWKVLAHAAGPETQSHRGSFDHDFSIVRQMQPDRFELYHLDDDLAEQHDCSTSDAERCNALSRELTAMFNEVVNEGPIWHAAAR